MFWKIYAGVITVVAGFMYGRVKTMATIIEELTETDDELDNINLDED